MPIVDVHTHMFTRGWLELLRTRGAPYAIRVRSDGREEIFGGETPVVFPQPDHFDYEIRRRTMDEATIDVSIVSLTCPNVYWGGEEVSASAARLERLDGRGAERPSGPDPLARVAAVGVPRPGLRGTRPKL